MNNRRDREAAERFERRQREKAERLPKPPKIEDEPKKIEAEDRVNRIPLPKPIEFKFDIKAMDAAIREMSEMFRSAAKKATEKMYYPNAMTREVTLLIDGKRFYGELPPGAVDDNGRRITLHLQHEPDALSWLIDKLEAKKENNYSLTSSGDAIEFKGFIESVTADTPHSTTVSIRLVQTPMKYEPAMDPRVRCEPPAPTPTPKPPTPTPKPSNGVLEDGWTLLMLIMGRNPGWTFQFDHMKNERCYRIAFFAMAGESRIFHEVKLSERELNSYTPQQTHNRNAFIGEQLLTLERAFTQYVADEIEEQRLLEEERRLDAEYESEEITDEDQE